ncbi:hypothetical protein M427DRAFT_65221 [Gonapodya prolifera JEL478]|uniref:Bromo domain-containing protein n=1 Tax=Gonapodya prolifera (strain JEL478) TaxID=1344416 RepID=A0A139AZJ6_GONPJ|nr:hypothetical protein M427DRAFT_65221 [Gonapodya prolifera JEL478]|eukprot:KXS22156.1 hypothetical protein M427DRAFT_65221 [Gonapodya prolifera JEL478]
MDIVSPRDAENQASPASAVPPGTSPSHRQFYIRRPGAPGSSFPAPDDEPGETSGAETSDSGISDRRTASGRNTDEERMKTWRKLILRVHDDISNLRCGPKYKNLHRQEDQEMNKCVRERVDLDSIKKGVRNGTITTTAQFHRHVLLMTLNPLMFYREGTPKYSEAAELRAQAEEIVRNCRMNLERAQGRRKESFGGSEWPPPRGDSMSSVVSMGSYHSDMDRSSPIPPEIPQVHQPQPIASIIPKDKDMKVEGPPIKRQKGK